MIRKKCDFFAAYSVKISNTSCAVSSPHVPLPPPTLAEDHLIDEERDPMRPAIMTHTATHTGCSIRQAITSREETEQLDLSSGGLNDLKTTKTRFAFASSRLFRSRVHRLSLPLCNRRTWDKVCPLQERNSQSPVFFFFFFFFFFFL